MAGKPQPFHIMSTSSTTATFLTIAEFKTVNKLASAQVVKNPKGDKKLFVATISLEGIPANYKCEQAIDGTKPMKFLIPDGDMSQACLVNVTESNNVVFEL